MELTVTDRCVKFRDPRLNLSEENQPKAVGRGIFGRLSNFDSMPPEYGWCRHAKGYLSHGSGELDTPVFKQFSNGGDAQLFVGANVCHSRKRTAISLSITKE